MTKEQQEAIERLETIDETVEEYDGNILKTDIETVLNMLKENSAEIQQKNTELAEKNAEIDLMAEEIEKGEIELTDEEILFIKGLESKLNVTEYSELRNIVEKYIQVAKNKNWEAEQKEKRIKSARERADEYYEKYNEETKTSDRWKKYYRELIEKYAKQDIELDLAKAK